MACCKTLLVVFRVNGALEVANDAWLAHLVVLATESYT